MIFIPLILISGLTLLDAFEICVTNNEKTDVKISCENTAERLHPNFTNVQLKVNEVNSVTIEYCGTPPGGFRLIDAINTMGITKFNYLTIQYPKIPLTREFLEGISVNSLKFHFVEDVSFIPGNLLQNVEVREKLSILGSNFPRIPQGFFQHLSNIKTLEITNNEIVKLQRDDLASLTGLKTLWLFSNRHAEIEEGVFDGLENLESIDLSQNHFTTLPACAFHKLKNLQEINLSANKLNELPSNLLRIDNSKLKIFRMNNAGVKSLPAAFFKDLRDLQVVQLRKNNFTSLPADLFSGAQSLKKVVLALNDIAELPSEIFNSATELTELDLSNNELTSLPDNIFSRNKLRKLNLSHNKLTDLTDGNLNGLSNLETLNIAKNPLSNIFPTLCEKLKSTKIIGFGRCP